MHTYLLNGILEVMGLEHWAQVSRASLYSSLKRLEKDGAVSVQKEAGDNTPDRKVFSITPKGREQLHEELKQALLTVAGADNVLFHLGVNLFFGATPDEGREWALIRIARLAEIREYLLKHIAEHVTDEMQCCGASAGTITLEAHAAHIVIEIEATEHFIALLERDPEFHARMAQNFASACDKRQNTPPSFQEGN